MAIEINGTTGISGVDGSATTPALQGQDTNTGISFGTDEVNIVTNGEVQAKVDSSGRVLIGQNDTTGVDAEADDLVVSSTAHTGITVRSGNNHNASLYFADQDAVRQGRIEYSQSGEFMRFNTSGTECFRFGDSGQLGVGGANYGTDGQVLTSQGNNAAPQWATPAEGLVDYGGVDVNGSNVATITGISLDCRNLKIYIMHFSCSNNNSPQISLRLGNGSVSSASYTGRVFEANSNTQESTGSNQINITHTGHTANSHVWTGIIDVGMSVSSGCAVSWNIFSSVNHCEFGAARWNGNNRIDRIQLLSSAGNWDGGYVRIFGDR